jgi:hypothetical protein
MEETLHLTCVRCGRPWMTNSRLESSRSNCRHCRRMYESLRGFKNVAKWDSTLTGNQMRDAFYACSRDHAKVIETHNENNKGSCKRSDSHIHCLACDRQTTNEDIAKFRSELTCELCGRPLEASRAVMREKTCVDCLSSEDKIRWMNRDPSVMLV